MTEKGSASAGLLGLHAAVDFVQILHHPRVEPFSLALSVFLLNLVQLQSTTHEIAEYLSKVGLLVDQHQGLTCLCKLSCMAPHAIASLHVSYALLVPTRTMLLHELL